jgi:Uma2 family endonuclease
MSTALKRVGLSEREYLTIERAATSRSEYHDGKMKAMSGASRPHSLIAGNLFSSIHAQLLGRPCEVHMSEMRVRVEATGSYVYPDIVALCGEAQLLDETFDTLTNPQLIVEVLSPSTENYDRGEKFERLKQLDSLQEYVLVAQERVQVERFSRQGGEWSLTTWETLESTVTLESIDCRVRVADIYARVTFPDRSAMMDE